MCSLLTLMFINASNWRYAKICMRKSFCFTIVCEGFGEPVNHTTRCGWWIALTSSIWQHRNQLIFQGKPFDPYKVMDHAIFLAWSWLKAKEKDFNISFNHWSSNISNSFGYAIFVPIWALSTGGLCLFVPKAKEPKFWGVPLVPWIPSISIFINIFLLGSIDKDSFIKYGGSVIWFC